MRESAEALQKLRGGSDFQEEFQEACSAASVLNEQQSPLDALRRPEVLKELHLGASATLQQEIVLMAFSRICLPALAVFK